MKLGIARTFSFIAPSSGLKVTRDDFIRCARPIASHCGWPGRQAKVRRSSTERQNMAFATSCKAVASGGAPGEKCRLIGAVAFFRHGARTPVRVLKTEHTKLAPAQWTAEMVKDAPEAAIELNFLDLQGVPIPDAFDRAYKGKSFPSGVFAGQLLTLGQLGHLDLGRQLRRRYVDQFGLIPGSYDRRKLHCRSTLFHRNLVSMRSLLAGLFPPEARKASDVIDVAVCTAEEDELLSNANVTRIFGLSSVIAENSREDWRTTRKDMVELLGCSENKELLLDEPFTSEDVNIHFLRDELVCRMHQGLPCPPISEELFRRVNQHCFELFVCEKVGLPPMREMFARKAVAGPPVNFILKMLRNLQEGKSSPVLSLFLTHDDFLTVLVEAIGLSNGCWPPFGSSFVVELFRASDGDTIAQVHFCGELVLSEPWPVFEKRLVAVALEPELVADLVEQHITLV